MSMLWREHGESIFDGDWLTYPPETAQDDSDARDEACAHGAAPDHLVGHARESSGW